MQYRWLLMCLYCHCVIDCIVAVFPKRIPIGAIFDRYSTRSITAFRYRLEIHNNSTAPFKLDQYEVVALPTDNQDVIKKVCGTMYKGVFALYGLTNSSTVDSISSFTSTFHMPYITTGLPEFSSFIHSNYTFHMRPSFTKAMVDVIRHYKWHHVFYIYDNSEGLSRLQRLSNLIQESGINLQLEAIRLTNVMNCYSSLRQLDSRKINGDKYIVLDLSTDEAFRQVLKQILNVGMNRATYHYLLGSLVMDELDLSAFQHGGMNITGFRLVDPDKPEVSEVQRNWSTLNPVDWKGAGRDQKIKLDVALTMDAVTVMSRGLQNLLDAKPDVFREVFRRGMVFNYEDRGIPCFKEEPNPWKRGPEISDAFRKVSFHGLTGNIEFDENGRRRNYNLDVLELGLNKHPKKIGTWNSKDRTVVIVEPSESNTSPDSRSNNTYIITTILSHPYLMYKTKPEADGKPLVGNERYEGYAADLAAQLAELTGFDYILRLVEDGQFGKSDQNGTWNGMIGELTNGKADLAIAPLTISSKRERVVHFSKPFMELGISIMIKKPEKQKPGVFSFMDPLSKDIWMCIIVAYLGVSLVLFLVSRFSPYEWQIEDSVNGPSFTNDFTLLNSLWFSLGAFMQQGCDISPRSLSGRIVGSVWWFFTLILISSYTANLAAFLTVERMLTPIESADDLAHQTEIQYGALRGGSTEAFFQFSTVGVYKRMWNFMESQNPPVSVNNTAAGVERVRNSKGKYAFLMDSTMNEFYNQVKPCNTMKVGQNLDSKGYGIATPTDSPLRDRINLAVLKLRESGALQRLKKKWWYDKGECVAEDSGSTSSALTLSNVAGIFYILIGGLGLAMMVSLLEFLYKSKIEARRQKKALANSFRQKARMSAHGSSDHENGGYTYSAPSQIINFDHTDYYGDGNHTQV